MPKTSVVPEGFRHWLKIADADWVEVGADEWLAAERQAGFHPQGIGPYATAGFSAPGIAGRLEYVEPPGYSQYVYADGWLHSIMGDYTVTVHGVVRPPRRTRSGVFVPMQDDHHG